MGEQEEDSTEEGILLDWFWKHILLSPDDPGLKAGAQNHEMLTVVDEIPAILGLFFFFPVVILLSSCLVIVCV